MAKLSPAFARLQALEIAWNKYKYPNLPETARCTRKYTDKTANGLTRAIIDFIKYNGWQAERINVMGRKIKTKAGREVYIKTTSTRGSADISATINGRSVKIEVKVGKDRQRVEQVKYEDMIDFAGGLYFIAKSFADFVAWYDEHGFGINPRLKVKL